jgi:hypothetical protein
MLESIRNSYVQSACSLGQTKISGEHDSKIRLIRIRKSTYYENIIYKGRMIYSHLT